jgi:GrpB-like predicted nucleotidyltransferase (UPF0157 family)
MRLGLSKDEVKLSKYTSEWNIEFNRVKQEIVAVTKLETKRIEHIGSTAIKDMVAKPIIDILIGIEDITHIVNNMMKALQSIGFLPLRVERQGEIVLAKFIDDTYKVKTHYIHLVDYDKELWKNLIFFRDYLNTIDEARDEYKKLKVALAERKSINITTYTNLKEPFVKGIFSLRTN